MINFQINAIASYRNLQRQVPQFDCYWLKGPVQNAKSLYYMYKKIYFYNVY